MSANFLRDDLDTMLSEDTFGNEGGVTWKGVVVTNAIFDDEDIEAQMGEGVAEIIAQPMVTGKVSDFIGIDTDDPITAKNEATGKTETFKVKNWKKDGTGMIEIFLGRT